MPIKLAILGLLMEKNMHPYEIRTIMKDRALDQNTKIQIGSLYYAVEQLAKQAYIEAVEVIKSDNRPDKTVYQITDKGKAYFEKLLLSMLEEIEPIHTPIKMALAFAWKGDQAKMADVLKKRVVEAEHQVNYLYELYQEHIGVVPRSVLHLMAGNYEHAKTELKWLKRLYQDAHEGRLAEIAPASILEDEE
ncbi:PadR family transcriptional regulator [Paenibacillus physcomitrellae]|uniref:Transcriptional regulator n=1 Tax=Paenibacillus physcomitrellae TaxID=1619311 RepID=A0ABQ1FSB0_9BACL|nr:PadR family transcriptional regulator [Paenibacillus physcomitrellae]GGA28017.1 transcriptional regulator [Paenibacillus physcomitrellae]